MWVFILTVYAALTVIGLMTLRRSFKRDIGGLWREINEEVGGGIGVAFWALATALVIVHWWALFFDEEWRRLVYGAWEDER